MPRMKAMTALISSCFRVLPQDGIIADFDMALPPSVITFSRYSLLKPLRGAPSLANAGAEFKLDIFEGPAGVELA